MSQIQSGVHWSANRSSVPGRLGRADLDGSNPIDIFVGGPQVTPGIFPPEESFRSLELDAVDERMYWIDDNGSVRSANLDYSMVEDIGDGALDWPGSLALDQVNRDVYWTTGETIRRAAMDGIGTPEDVILTMYNVTVEVDPVGGKIYWSEVINGPIAEPPTFPRIRSANLDGSGQETVFTFTGPSIVGAHDMEIDAETGKLYWVQLSGIQRIDVHTLDVEDINMTAGVSRSIALDAVNDRLYWAEPWVSYPQPYQRQIRSADLDGSNVVNVLLMDEFVEVSDLEVHAPTAATPPPTSGGGGGTPTPGGGGGGGGTPTPGAGGGGGGTPTPTPIPPPGPPVVGGIAGLLDADDPAPTSEPSSDTIGYVAALAGVAALIAGGWYARRRLSR
jgi:hypothetical protein